MHPITKVGIRPLLAAVAVTLGAVQTANATILFEDTMYWRPGGVTVINPVVPPTDAFVKIQETVYDNVEGRQVLQQQLNFNLIHGNGGVIPPGNLNVYGYSITNLNYNNGASGAGAGVTGYHVQNLIGPGYTMYAPSNANSNWAENTSPPASFGWDIDANNNRLFGDGIGILLGQTHNSFYLVVPNGTVHGFVNASIHTWTGGGLLEQPNSIDVDYIFGLVSGPLPEPASIATLGFSGLIFLRRRSRA
jgi:hypothetical protein